MQPQPGVQERHCAHCGEKFTTRHAGQYHCSVRCHRAAGAPPTALAAALSALAAPVPGAPAGLAGVAARIERLSQPHVEQLLKLTSHMLGLPKFTEFYLASTHPKEYEQETHSA